MKNGVACHLHNKYKLTPLEGKGRRRHSHVHMYMMYGVWYDYHNLRRFIFVGTVSQMTVLRDIEIS